jgi:Tol biopolymer transport system component
LREIDVATLFSATDLQDLDIHPDGRKAICSVNNGANWELAVLNLTNGAVRKLLAGPQSLMSPRFSPDGRRIAYHVDFEGNENHDVVVVGADGRGAKKITDSVEDNYSPQFSPDGESIAFISNRVRDLDNLYTVGSKGGKMKRLTNEPLPVRQFAWSPDGMRIAYVTGVGDDDHVSVADTTRLKTKSLLCKRGVEYSLSGEWGDSSPWSPDGNRVLFLSNEHDWSDIGQLDLESSKVHWVAKSKNDKHQPQWSPDGS